jgi:hypothetical protein
MVCADRPRDDKQAGQVGSGEIVGEAGDRPHYPFRFVCFRTHRRVAADDQVRRAFQRKHLAQVPAVTKLDPPVRIFSKEAERGIIARRLLKSSPHNGSRTRSVGSPGERVKLCVDAAFEPGEPDAQQGKGQEQNGPKEEEFLPVHYHGQENPVSRVGCSAARANWKRPSCDIHATRHSPSGPRRIDPAPPRAAPFEWPWFGRI